MHECECFLYACVCVCQSVQVTYSHIQVLKYSDLVSLRFVFFIHLVWRHVFSESAAVHTDLCVRAHHSRRPGWGFWVRRRRTSWSPPSESRLGLTKALRRCGGFWVTSEPVARWRPRSDRIHTGSQKPVDHHSPPNKTIKSVVSVAISCFFPSVETSEAIWWQSWK